MEREEKRWHSEVKALAAAIAVLLLLCVALIAQTFWGNGAMLAILLGGLVIGLAIRYLPPALRHPRTH